VLRRQLLPGVLEAAASNLKHTPSVRLFEVGSVYLPVAREKLPAEPRRLAIVLAGRRSADFWAEAGSPLAPIDFFDLKGMVEALVGDLHLPNVAYRPVRQVPYLHPGQAAELVIGDQAAGVFGLLHPKVAEAYDLAGRDVLAAELDLQAILAAVPDRHLYRPVPRFPAALRDVAVIIPEATPADRVVAEIRAAGGELLHDARLFDLYRGDSIPPGTKSLAFALSYQASDRTLTDKEVDKAHKKIEDRLKHVLQAQIRGKEG
jgi:phenylalanyl-tRNA synthetase beta chain